MRSFSEGLTASGPAVEHREKLMLYGQFIGDWVTETTDWAPDGTVHTSRWDVRFDWVLEGRAIQDVWITPPRKAAAAAPALSDSRYGTTLRTYDPKIDAWHIIWCDPPSGTVVRQMGRRVRDDIVQLGEIGTNGVLSRWVFKDISASTFRWCNETSPDNGYSWRLAQEMRARRVT